MYMTDIEIVGSFKRALKQKEQVVILAQLNACDKEDIIEVLKKNGIDTTKVEEQLKPRKRPSNCKKEKTKVEAKKINEVVEPIKKQVAEKPAMQKKAEDKPVVPKIIISIVQERIATLTELINETEKERDALCNYLEGVVSNG